jgi:hypothetical protein
MIDFPISLFNSPKGLKSGKVSTSTYVGSIAKWIKKRIFIIKPQRIKELDLKNYDLRIKMKGSSIRKNLAKL